MSKLDLLRQQFDKYGIAAYYIPERDAHYSEYIGDSDARRAYISGFTGSSGFAIVTNSAAALWTDGRYFLQASKQLNNDWILMKIGLPGVPTKEEWLEKELGTIPSKVGVDPLLITYQESKKLMKSLKKNGHELVAISKNLVDEIWWDRPKRNANKIFPLPVEYSGRDMSNKIEWVQEYLKNNNYHALVLSALDEIAWLLNLRGSDIKYNPLFFAYARVHVDDIILYINSEQLDADAKRVLEGKVKIRPYDHIFADLKQQEGTGKILFTLECNWSLYSCIDPERCEVKLSPVNVEKSIKNPVEIEGFRQCHLRDAAALIEYFGWLEDAIGQTDFLLDEVDVSLKLKEYRAKQKHFVGLSFSTISAMGPNGAIIHYNPEKKTAAKLTRDNLYLLDSGGQYLDGTTDVTRTLHFGVPTAHQKACFTRVLQGNIALNQAIFPEGTTGTTLDILARMPLWKAGLDYRHGTGHGVGHFLQVHEGPQRISKNLNIHPLRPGMTISDEPGYYEEAAFGIRIENVLIVQPAKTPFNFDNTKFYGFENITMVPIQQRLIEWSMMTNEEIAFLNEFHAAVRVKIGPLLDPNGLGYAWMMRETKPYQIQ